MNQKAAYELTITEKLEQLTVPDMVDAIWERIETQLDIDMPPDQGPSDPPHSPLTGGGFRIGGLFIAALIATIYLITNNSNTNENNQQNSADSVNIISSPLNTIDRSPPAPGTQSSPSINPGQNNSIPAIINNDSAVTPVLNDSSTKTLPDSSGNALTTDAPPVTQQPDTTSKKKGRGVKGIKDSDYRIEPVKKDSTN